MKKYFVLASFSGALAVLLGAFGAHSLKNILSDSQMYRFETAVRYQIIHSLLALIVLLIPFLTVRQMKIIIKTLFVGVFCFCGSIYILVTGFVSAGYIWFVTPLGGLLIIISWMLIGYYALKQKSV
ncbi:MAG: DUF423 domain-containing protein [Wenyingzhuangia sp.]|jgi:uncharacterized membrane protein YgdD (TMEM256/DUF423 family)|uniref:DUF423 domain-containing protein n=1 Tax=Wenyingzhuangia sp. TaxID=1964193 RepID=UPI003219C2F3